MDEPLDFDSLFFVRAEYLVAKLQKLHPQQSLKGC